MIKVNDLCKFYNNTEVLKHISFETSGKEAVGILGRKDSGKTTLINIMTGCVIADSGTVLICDNDIVKKSKRAKACFGFVPSDISFYPEMTVRSFLSYSARLKGFHGSALQKEVDNALWICSNGNILDGKISYLSLFEQRLILVAQALIGQPKILIFDSPTVGLTPSETESLRTLLTTLKSKHSFIIASSRLSDALSLCDRILILNNGEIVADRSVSDFSEGLTRNESLRLKVSASPELIERIFTSIEKKYNCNCYPEMAENETTFNITVESNIDLRASLFSECSVNNITILEMHKTSLSAEDIYFQLTSDGGNT